MQDAETILIENLKNLKKKAGLKPQDTEINA